MGFDFSRNIGVFAGYRYWALDFEWDSDEYDFNNGSIYAGMEVRF